MKPVFAALSIGCKGCRREGCIFRAGHGVVPAPVHLRILLSLRAKHNMQWMLQHSTRFPFLKFGDLLKRAQNFRDNYHKILGRCIFGAKSYAYFCKRNTAGKCLPAASWIWHCVGSSGKYFYDLNLRRFQ